MWVERIMPAYTHNRWARGVCDTGNANSFPLETNPLANFTGRGEIVGLSDTGECAVLELCLSVECVVSYQLCYGFHDELC